MGNGALRYSDNTLASKPHVSEIRYYAPIKGLTRLLWDSMKEEYVDMESKRGVIYVTVGTTVIFPNTVQGIEEIALENKPSIANAYLAVVKEQNVCIQYVRIA